MIWGIAPWIKAGSQLWKLFSIISLRVMVTTCSNLSRLGMLRKVEVYYSCLQLEQHTIRWELPKVDIFRANYILWIYKSFLCGHWRHYFEKFKLDLLEKKRMLKIPHLLMYTRDSDSERWRRACPSSKLVAESEINQGLSPPRLIFFSER